MPEHIPDLSSTEPPVAPLLLVVEDEHALRTLTARFFRMHSFQVTEAANGSEGIEALRNGPPAIALVDVIMPVMGGEEFILRVRELQFDFPILLLSASPEAYEMSERFGCDGVIEKPFNIAQLVSKVAEILERAA